MLKKILAILAMLYAAACFAAVDVNKATAAELDSVKGIGPAISAKIVDERKNGAYKDWDDLITRVKGVGDKSAVKLSEGGLTVNGSAYKGASATTTTTKEAKAAAKEEKKDDKMSGMAMGKDEKKSAKTKKEEKAEAKAEAKAAKAAKAESAKPAASAASVAKTSASAKK